MADTVKNPKNVKNRPAGARKAQQAGVQGRGTLAALGALLLAVPGAGAAGAVTYAMPSDESMVDRTPVIVYGLVIAGAPAPEGPPAPATDFTVRVEEVLRGQAPAGALVVRQLGGSGSDGMAMKVAGLPMLQPGQRVLLFLSERHGVYRTVGFALGIFFETRLAGRTVLEREPGLRDDVVGNVDANLLGPRDGEAFRRWIGDRAVGVTRAADYFVSGVDLDRGRHEMPYRHMRNLDPDCRYYNETIRRLEFENGETVPFWLQEGGQPGLSWSVTRQVVNDAMYAWNRDSRSRVDLRYYREGRKPDPGEWRQGRNMIMFEDPFDYREDALDLEEGGVLAWALVWYRCHEPPVARPAPWSQYDDVAITQAQIVTARGFGEYLQRWSNGATAMRENFEELMAHELGHTLGFGHSCGDVDEGGSRCDDPAEDEAVMRATAHWDRRGAALSSDDRTILRRTYPSGSDDDEDEDDGGDEDEEDDEDDEDRWRGPLPKGEHSECIAEKYAFFLKGDSRNHAFGVWMCYHLPAGWVGDGKGGLWEIDSAGLLWFFDKNNPEVLIKVLDGCSFNGRWWVFLAPVTDLAFNLRVDRFERIGGDWGPTGERWPESNRQGDTARTRSDTAAFPCVR